MSTSEPKVAVIKGHRKRGGELQYSVQYEGEKGSKCHWIAASDLKCQDVIDAYEESRRGEPRKVVEIFGLARTTSMSFVVRFSDTPKPEIVTRGFMHKHAQKLLLEFYEKHFSFIEQKRADDTKL